MNLSHELRLQAIIDGTRAGTREWNVRTGEVVFNERWAAMLGFSLEEIQPLSIVTVSKQGSGSTASMVVQKTGRLYG